MCTVGVVRYFLAQLTAYLGETSQIRIGRIAVAISRAGHTGGDEAVAYQVLA